MSKMIFPMELYTAARETCLRLYIANGGDPRDKWTIRPYPGTAAIACKTLNVGRPTARNNGPCACLRCRSTCACPDGRAI